MENPTSKTESAVNKKTRVYYKYISIDANLMPDLIRKKKEISTSKLNLFAGISGGGTKPQQGNYL